MTTTTPKTHRGGNPTKYKDEYCQLLIDHMSEGMSFEAFAGLLGVNRTTLYTWLVAHQEFREAKEIADQKSRLWAETMLKNMVEGKVKSHPISLIFYLKNRFPRDWRDRRELDIQKQTDNEATNLTLDQQIERVEQMKTHLLTLKAQSQSEAQSTIEIEAEPSPKLA